MRADRGDALLGGVYRWSQGICTQELSECIRIQTSFPLYNQRCNFPVSEAPIFNNQYSTGLLKPSETKYDLRIFLIVKRDRASFWEWTEAYECPDLIKE